jgi:hypothetical protein
MCDYPRLFEKFDRRLARRRQCTARGKNMNTYTIEVEGYGTFRNIPSWDRSGGQVSFVDPATGLRHIFTEGCAVHSFQQVSEPAGGGLTRFDRADAAARNFWERIVTSADLLKAINWDHATIQEVKQIVVKAVFYLEGSRVNPQ